MKISVNKIRTVNGIYQAAGDPAPHGIQDLVDKIGAQLGAVEEVIDYGKRFEGVIIAQVVSCVDHDNSDHLHVCKIDDGGVAKDVERDENGYVQVVCGAPNVREGIKAAWLPPGSTVPESYDTEEPFVLSARPLRGVVSNGMLASARELSIGEDHDGILEITDDIAPGTSFAEAYDLVGETVIDIENKMFTHRPDCFGLLGVARELEGIQGRAYKSPDWYTVNPTFPEVQGNLPLTIRNELPAKVPRYMVATLSDVIIKPSPLWLRIYLAEMGVKSINNVVDLTNWFMLETGQPLHAYDYDKVKAQDANATEATLVIRYPKQGEKVKLLNGKEIEPRERAIMIATNDKLVSVGGIMGGSDTEVDANTKNVILECGTFDMYSVRRTSMTHGLFTDAVTRNNKGQSPLQVAAVLAKIIDELTKNGDAKLASPIIDDNHLEVAVRERGALQAPVKVSAEFINVRLGLSLSSSEMRTLLTNVEFIVQEDGDDLIVQAPFWRTDIEIAEDIVEEIGRLYGFDHLPLTLPKRSITPAARDKLLTIKERIRDVLSGAGANEVLTYSFVHGKLLQKAAQDPDLAFELSNAISPDLQYYRESLTPSLLDKVHANVKAGYNKFAIFELNKTHNLLHQDTDNGLPGEFAMLSLVTTANDKQVEKGEGAAFYDARKYLMHLTDTFGITVQFEPLEKEPNFPVVKPFDMKRSALVRVKGTDIYLGIIGEFKTSVRKQFKLPVHTAGFEIGLLELMGKAVDGAQYVQLPRFPKVGQDICLKVPISVSHQDLYNLVWNTLAEIQPENTLPSLNTIDIYQRQDDPSHKQITFRFAIASYDKTMTDSEVSKMLDHVTAVAQKTFTAERI